MKENKMMFIWILIPMIYGFVYNSFLLFIPPVLNLTLFTIFWFWLGIKFGSLSGNPFKNFFVGNSIWLFSFFIFLWQFVFVDGDSRNMFLAGIGQYYMIPFTWIGIKLSLLYSTNTVDGTLIIIFSYLYMLVVFIIGFTVGKIMTRIKN